MEPKIVVPEDEVLDLNSSGVEIVERKESIFPLQFHDENEHYYGMPVISQLPPIFRMLGIRR